MRGREGLAVAGISLAGLALAAAAARGPLWLDEVWTLEGAAAAPSTLAALTLHTDNAHWTAALWAHWIGGGASEIVLRAPALLAHALLPLLVFGLVRPAGAARAFLAAATFAAAAPAVRFGSELRGYAPALACRLAAERGRALPVLAAAPLGVASHLTGWLPLAALPALAPRGRGRTIAISLLPAAALAGALALFDVRSWTVPGGETLEPWRGFLAAAALWACGLPSPLLGLLVFPLLVLACARGRRPLVLLAVLLAPPLAATALGVDYAPPRYSFVPLGFLWPDLFRLPLPRGPAGAAFAAAVCALPLYLGRDLRLVRLGRCPVRPALAEALRREPAGPVTVGADFDLRHEPLVRHHAARMPGGRRLRYRRAGGPPPRFLLLHRIRVPGGATPSFPDEASHRGVRYTRVAVFPTGSDEGWVEALYERAADPPR